MTSNSKVAATQTEDWSQAGGVDVMNSLWSCCSVQIYTRPGKSIFRVLERLLKIVCLIGELVIIT